MRPLTKLTIFGIRLGVIVLIVYWTTIFVGTHIPKLPTVTPKVSDKSLHFGAFFGLGLLMCYVSKPSPPIRRFGVILLVALIYAAIDETTQALVPNRAPDWRDFIADSCGLLSAVAFYLMVRSLVRRISGSRTASGVV